MADRLSEIPVLPTWLECQCAVEAGTATALQRFIAEREPAAADLRDPFRAELAELLADATSIRRPEPRTVRRSS